MDFIPHCAPCPDLENHPVMTHFSFQIIMFKINKYFENTLKNKLIEFRLMKSNLNICLIIRKYFFTVRLAEHWGGLLRDVVESPSLEILKTQPEMVTSKCALDDSALSCSVGLDDLQTSSPTTIILCFSNHCMYFLNTLDVLWSFCL